MIKHFPFCFFLFTSPITTVIIIQAKVAKPTGRRRVSGEGRQEKMYRRQPYDYAFKLQVINYYATAGINATISRFFYITDDDPKGSTRMFVLKRKQQRAQIEQRAGKQQLPAINAIVSVASRLNFHNLHKLQS